TETGGNLVEVEVFFKDISRSGTGDARHDRRFEGEGFGDRLLHRPDDRAVRRGAATLQTTQALNFDIAETVFVQVLSQLGQDIGRFLIWHQAHINLGTGYTRDHRFRALPHIAGADPADRAG